MLSLNMLHGFPRFKDLEERMDLIGEEIRQGDADVVLLQEVPWIPRLGSVAQRLSELLGMNYASYRANGNRWAILFEEGEAILSRYPLRDAVAAELEPCAGRFEHRVALGAVVSTPYGDLPVFVTHLTNGSPEVNRGQAAALHAFVSGITTGPALVAGDFNATEASPQIVDLTEEWIDTFRAVLPVDDGFTCCVNDLRRGPDEPLEKRIDYLFLVPAPGARILSAERAFDHPYRVGGGWQWASDHVGLAVTVELVPSVHLPGD